MPANVKVSPALSSSAIVSVNSDITGPLLLPAWSFLPLSPLSPLQMSSLAPSDVTCGRGDSFEHNDSGNQDMSLIIVPYLEPPTQDLSMNQLEVPVDSGYEPALDEFVIANFTNLVPNAHCWGETYGPSTDNILSELETFLMERPLSRSSMSSFELLPDPTYVPSASASPEHRAPTPPIESLQPQSATPASYLFFNVDTDVPARQADLRNFVQNPWADKVPDELVLALLERVQLLKTSRGKGARKGAQGYFCHWPGCTKTGMTIRLDHAKAHVAQHVGVKPFKCTECARPFLRRADLKRHNKTCYARRVEV